MKKIGTFLIIFVLLLVNMAEAQDYTANRVRGKVWKSGIVENEKEGAHYVVLSFNDDNTFEKRVYYSNGTPEGGMLYKGTYSEMPGKLSLRNNRLPIGQQATKYEEEVYSNNLTWTNNKEFLFHGVLFSSKFGNYRFHQQEEFGIAASRDDSIIVEGQKVVHRNMTKEYFNELVNKVWQEQLPSNLSGSNYTLSLISFGKEGHLQSTYLRFNKNDQKISMDYGLYTGLYSEDLGYLVLSVENNKKNETTTERIPFYKISKNEFTIGLGENQRRFVIFNSGNDLITQKFTVPYVKRLVEGNLPIISILEPFALPFLSVTGKTFVTTVMSPETGNETILFARDGTFVGEYQLKPVNGSKIRMGIYSVEGDKLTVITTRADVRKTTVYKLAWLNSSEFQLSVGTEKPIKYKIAPK